MKELLTFATMAVLYTWADAASTAADPYQFNDGVLVIEVESVEPTGFWVQGNSISNYLGSGYFEWKGADFFGSPGEGLLRYWIEVPESGFYEMRIRSYNLAGIDQSEHNDVWVQVPAAERSDSGLPVPDRAVKVYQHDLGRWTWESVAEQGGHYPLRFYLEAGVHSLLLSGRSSEFAIDRLMLFRYRYHKFTESESDQLPESPLRSEAGAGFVHSASISNGKVQLLLNATQSGAVDSYDPVVDYIWNLDGTSVGKGPLLKLRFAEGGPVSIHLKTIRQSGSQSDNYRRISLPFPKRSPDLLKDALPGVIWQSYSGRYNELPDFNEMVSSGFGRDAGLDYSRFTDRLGAYRFIGYYKAESTGPYRLIARTDTGLRIRLGDRTVIENHGLIPEESMVFDVELEPGFHRLSVEFFHSLYDNLFKLEIQIPGEEGSSEVPVLYYHPEYEHPWQDAWYAGDDWYYSNWFGYFVPGSEEGWVYTLDAGWLYVWGSDPGNVWMWSYDLDYLWTNQIFFPYVYRYSTTDWEFWSSP